jgi:DNA-binding PadR family transcriptional regulator
LSLGDALTALLMRRPAHGYELRTVLEAELSSLWITRPSQVYLTLGRLTRDGLIRGTHVRQERRPDRTVFQLTPMGRRAGEAWLAGPGDSEEIPVRLAVGRLVDAERFPVLIETIVAERRAALRRLRALQTEALGGFAPEALEREIRLTEADLRWLDAVGRDSHAIAERPAARRAADEVRRLG